MHPIRVELRAALAGDRLREHHLVEPLVERAPVGLAVVVVPLLDIRDHVQPVEVVVHEGALAHRDRVARVAAALGVALAVQRVLHDHRQRRALRPDPVAEADQEVAEVAGLLLLDHHVVLGRIQLQLDPSIRELGLQQLRQRRRVRADRQRARRQHGPFPEPRRVQQQVALGGVVVGAVEVFDVALRAALEEQPPGVVVRTEVVAHHALLIDEAPDALPCPRVGGRLDVDREAEDLPAEAGARPAPVLVAGDQPVNRLRVVEGDAVVRVDVARFQRDPDRVGVGEDRVVDLVHVRRAHVALGEGHQPPAGVGVVAVGVEAPGTGADQHGLLVARDIHRRRRRRTGRVRVAHPHIGGQRAHEPARLAQVEAEREVVDRLGARNHLAQVVGRRAAARDALIADRLVAVRRVRRDEVLAVVELHVRADVEDPGQVVGRFPRVGDIRADLPLGAGVLPEVVGQLVERDPAVLREAVVHVTGGVDRAVVAGAVPGEADQRQLRGRGALEDAPLLDRVALAVALHIVRGCGGRLLLLVLLLLGGSFLLLLLLGGRLGRCGRRLRRVVVVIVVAAADQRQPGRADACAGACRQHRAPRKPPAAHPRPIVALH